MSEMLMPRAEESVAAGRRARALPGREVHRCSAAQLTLFITRAAPACLGSECERRRLKTCCIAAHSIARAYVHFHRIHTHSLTHTSRQRDLAK